MITKLALITCVLSITAVNYSHACAQKSDALIKAERIEQISEDVVRVYYPHYTGRYGGGAQARVYFSAGGNLKKLCQKVHVRNEKTRFFEEGNFDGYVKDSVIVANRPLYSKLNHAVDLWGFNDYHLKTRYAHQDGIESMDCFKKLP